MKGTATLCLLALASVTRAAPSFSDARFPETLEEWTPESLIKPEELGGHFEGDIKLPLPPVERNGLIDENFRWPNGQVFYQFDSDFPDSGKRTVREAMARFPSQTNQCITFTERASEPNFILFTQEDDGCSSFVGMTGGLQPINLDNGCLASPETAQHEILHALGFHHEHSRSDRDDYVTIMWENIKDGYEFNFNMYPPTFISGFGEKYDYGSLMHYTAYAFSKNKQKTIVTKDPNVEIGVAKDFSPVDLKKLMKMYKC